MWFRMLKKDLTDKIGLNITLFVFMILASVFVMISTVLMFSGIFGANRTYRMCNTADLLVLVEQSIADKEGQQNEITQWFQKIPEVGQICRKDCIMAAGDHVKYDNVDIANSAVLASGQFSLSDVPTENDIPYNLEDRIFQVKDGGIAIPQNLSNTSKSKIGDKIRLTTQMGNVYEFTVSEIYKDPSAESCPRLFFSAHDFDVIYRESPVKYDFFEIYLNEFEGDYVERLLTIGTKLINDYEKMGNNYYAAKTLFLCNDGIMSLAVSIVMIIVSIFMLIMIFITIHFSLKSAMKREEKEIGMMKAIGVYSLSYRVLFAVKYIAFAIVGGIIGIPIAIPLSKLLVNTFIVHTILPNEKNTIVLAIVSVCACIAVIIGFTLLAMRRMGRISVMDAIHGENKGERFKKGAIFYLHKMKHINISLFMAISDIMGRLKRYSYLILAYVAGISIILLVIQMKDTIMNEKYPERYWQNGPLDFYMDMDDSYYSKLYEKTGSDQGVVDLVNENFAQSGIPARAEYFDCESVKLIFNGQEAGYTMRFGEPDRNEVVYIKGGKVPTLYNEIALPSYNAKQAGIKIGDVVTLEFRKYNEDHFSSQKVTEDFIVTAFFDGFGSNVPLLIMGNEFDGAVMEWRTFFKFEMDCADAEYDSYFDKMDQLYTDDEIRFIHKDNVLDYIMGNFSGMFTLMLIVVSIVVSIVLVLLTVLYQNIFIEEETGDVAVLKSMGFDKVPIKLWQYFRILILVLLSIVIAQLFIATIGNYVIGKITASILKIVEFHMISKFLACYVILPGCVLILISASLVPVLKTINQIQIWRVRNE